MRIPLGDIRKAVEEMADLRGLHIDNVYQCDAAAFLLKLKPGPRVLLLNLWPGRARVLVTDEPPPVPKTPPVFGLILRKALRGGRFLGAVMPAEDRVVFLDIDAGEPLRLVVEALPRHGNLLLLDANGTITRVMSGDAARHRGNAVGNTYALPQPRVFPPEDSLLPDDLPDEPFAANHALDRIARGERTERDEAKLERVRTQTIARLKKLHRAVSGDLREVDDPARLRKQGETLLTHYGELKQGMKSFKSIPLDAKLSPQENVDRLFQRARKSERGKPFLTERLAHLEDLLGRVEAGEEIPEHMVPAARKARQQEPRKPYRVYKSADGARILVGKGGRDNDETTMRVAGPHDLFLHVRGSPGAHVIIPLRRDEDPLEQTLLDAATLALHYSKMRTAAAADVSYCRRKFVSKPRGAKPGLVQVQRERVIRLRREPDRLARLLMSTE